MLLLHCAVDHCKFFSFPLPPLLYLWWNTGNTQRLRCNAHRFSQSWRSATRLAMSLSLSLDKESPNEPTMPCVRRVPCAPSLKPVFQCYNTIMGHLCNIVTFKRKQKSVKTIIKVGIFQYHLSCKNLDFLLGWSSSPSSLELLCLGHFSHYFDSSCKHQWFSYCCRQKNSTYKSVVALSSYDMNLWTKSTPNVQCWDNLLSEFTKAKLLLEGLLPFIFQGNAGHKLINKWKPKSIHFGTNRLQYF